MRERTKRRIAVLLFVLAVVGSGVACGQGNCYSEFPGCEATAEALSTAAAHGE